MLKKSKIMIVQATFYQDISKMLLEGAIAKIKENGYDYEAITVPGAFEIPATIAMIAKSKLYQNEVAGYVALGCVIRGINKLAIKHQLAIGYGIITVENKEQAIARADVNQKNKGGFASQACIEMIKIKEKFIE
ncbi:MAG: 6,7-dimethyl-8-ribityllumazine synthase [Rickettsiales bacterium]|nr:6,7-dimethyl-8-ribityllumazine synthase [Rickettsiales bacterium]